MCAPLIPLAVMAAASAGSAVAEHQAQAQQANAAAKFQNKRYSQTSVIAMENYLRTIGQTQLRLQQDTAATAENALQNRLAGQAAQATATTSAAESGVQGNSVQMLLNDFARHEATNNDALHQNLQWEQMQADENLRSAQAQAKAGIASATPQPITGPSNLALGLKLGAIAASTATQAYGIQRGNTPSLTNTGG